MPKRATEKADASRPPDEIMSLARELASAFMHELRAQLNGDTEQATPETRSEKRVRLAKERAFELYKAFDHLPDDALVGMRVVTLLEDCSNATAHRRIRAGLIPAPEHVGGMTRFRVGALRAARAAPADQSGRGTRIGPLRASAAAKTKRKTSTETPIEPRTAPPGPERERGAKRSRTVKTKQPVEAI